MRQWIRGLTSVSSSMGCMGSNLATLHMERCVKSCYLSFLLRGTHSSFIHTCKDMYIHAYMHTCIHSFIYTYNDIHIWIYSFIHTKTNIHACIHTYTHTYIYILLSLRNTSMFPPSVLASHHFWIYTAWAAVAEYLGNLRSSWLSSVRTGNIFGMVLENRPQA